MRHLIVLFYHVYDRRFVLLLDVLYTVLSSLQTIKYYSIGRYLAQHRPQVWYQPRHTHLVGLYLDKKYFRNEHVYMVFRCYCMHILNETTSSHLKK